MPREQNQRAGQAAFAAEHSDTFRTLVSVAKDKLHALEQRTVHGHVAGCEQGAVLFAGVGAGPAGVAATQLARELGRDLYRVDLRAVVSRYLGETEKNLSRVLETAERTGAVLLFDEGDALFGERTQVRDSHDRYSELDVTDLLRRLQDFDGLAILACSRCVAELGNAVHSFDCVIELPTGA